MKYRTIASSPETLMISFSIDKTNGYAPLVIKVNGREVKRDVLPRGNYELSIDNEFLSNEMDIEIYPESSSWKFWAPTVYELSSINIATESFNERPYVFNFDLSDKFTTFKSGRMNINLFENKGKLMVIVNNNTIFDDAPGNYQNVEFYRESVVDGLNVLELRASEGSNFIGNAVLAIKYTSTQENKISQIFEVTNNTYNQFLNGEISFDITDVSQEGGVQISIENDNGKTFTKFENAQSQRFTYDLNITNIAKGTNNLVIESLGGAVFAVKNVRVSV